jgi:hypothetical protein
MFTIIWITSIVICIPVLLLSVRVLEKGLTATDIVFGLTVSCLPIVNIILSTLVFCEATGGRKFFVPKD